MSKSILIMDTPKACIDCPCHFADDVKIWCGKEKRDIETDDIETFKPNWCPLGELPNEMSEKGRYSRQYRNGFNRCIYEILKRCNWNGEI